MATSNCIYSQYNSRCVFAKVVENYQWEMSGGWSDVLFNTLGEIRWRPIYIHNLKCSERKLNHWSSAANLFPLFRAWLRRKCGVRYLYIISFWSRSILVHCCQAVNKYAKVERVEAKTPQRQLNRPNLPSKIYIYYLFPISWCIDLWFGAPTKVVFEEVFNFTILRILFCYV